jgi:hypothetical protein
MTLDEALEILLSEFPALNDANNWIKNFKQRGAQALTRALISGNCPAGSLDFSYGFIKSKTVQALGKVLNTGTCPSGLQIRLDHNRLYNCDIKVLARALRSGKCPSGLYLNLMDTSIDNSGTKVLSKALASGNCPSGLYLNLRDNQISNKGCVALAHALKSGKCPKRLRLDLDGNNIGDSGAEVFANALRSGNCPAGLHLNFGYGRIGTAGANALVNSVLSGMWRYETKISSWNKLLEQLCQFNNRRIRKSTALAIATMIGGSLKHKTPLKSSAMLSIVENIYLFEYLAKFLPGNISVQNISNSLDQSFQNILNNNSCFSDEFLQGHRTVNQSVQHVYDKKFGVSLWNCSENYRTQYHKKNRIWKLCTIL